MGGWMCCAVPVFGGLWFWTAALHAGIALANRVLGGVIEEPPDVSDYDWDAEYDDRPRVAGPAVRQPNVFHAAGIVLLTGVVNVGIIYAFSEWGGVEWPGLLLVGPVLYFVAVGLLSALLPARFPKACLVILFQWLFFVGVAGGLLLVGVLAGWR